VTPATDRAALPRAVKIVGGVGAILFWVVLQALLAVGTPVADALLLAVLFVAVPVIGAAQLPLVEGVRVERLRAYWGSIAALWLLGSAAWLVGTRTSGPAGVGLVALPVVNLLVWTLGLTLGALLIMFVFRQVAGWLDAKESPLLRDLLPSTEREKGVFALLSVAAGVGEELAYRGYSLPLVASLLGLPAAFVLTSVVFGALHAYQGLLGTVRTALMGALLAWGFMASGSLWPAILAHIAIDLVAGIVLGERLLPPLASSGVAVAPHAPANER